MRPLLARGTPPWITIPWVVGALLWSAVRMTDSGTVWLLLPFLSLLTGLFLLWFFRDPHREPARGLVCPADGVLIHIDQERERTRFVVFMNPFNVHVNRAPLAGKVISQTYHRGGFKPAYQADAAVNERLVTRLESDLGEVVVTQIAGVLVRRIVSYVKEGQRLEAGQRIGLIRFGSRVEVELPSKGLDITVKKGQKVLAGTTALASLDPISTEGDDR